MFYLYETHQKTTASDGNAELHPITVQNNHRYLLSVTIFFFMASANHISVILGLRMWH